MKNDTRVKVLALIKEREKMTLAEIAVFFGLSVSAVRQHLVKLLDDGEVVKRYDKSNNNETIWHYAKTAFPLQSHWKTSGLTSVNVEDTIAP